MARDLRLEVVLQAIDRATKPLRQVTKGSSELARALKASQAQLKQLKQQQSDISSYQKQSGAVRKTSESLDAAREKLRDYRTQLKGMTAPSDKFQKDFIKAKATVDQLTQKHQAQRAELARVAQSLKKTGISTSQLGTHETRLKSEVDAVNKSLQAQRDRLAAITREQEAQARLAANARKIHQAGMMTAAHGVAGVYGGQRALRGMGRLIQPGIEFDATMSRVQALTRLDRDGAQLKALREQARQLGAETMFSATEAAEGQAFLAMAGFTPEAIMQAMPGLLDMSKAGDMDLGRGADIASNILGSFGLDPSQMGNVADILTKAFTTSNTTLEMLGGTMKYVGPVARAAGMSLEEAAAMAGLLGNVGIQAEKSGTTLRAMILRLASPAGTAAKAMKELGLETMDSEGNVRNMVAILDDVARATEQMGGGERLDYLKRIFGEEPAAGMAELLDQAGIGGITKYLDVIGDHAGAAAKTAKIMGDNIVGDLDELSSAWDDVRISLFDEQSGALRGLVQALTSVVRGLGEWVKENPRLASALVAIAAILAVLVTVLGALALAAGSMMMLAPILVKGWLLLGNVLPLVASGIKLISAALLTNPIGLAVTAIAAAAYLIYRNWSAIGGWFADRWAEVKTAFSQGIFGIGKLLLNWSPLGLLYRAITAGLSALGIEVPEKFRTLGGAIVDGLLAGFFNGVAALKDAIVGVAGSAVGWFKEKLGIRSPSRVFAALGGDTMAGLDKGLAAGARGPLATVADTARQLVAAGAMAIGAGGALALDARPPIAAGSGPVIQGDTITIHINAGTGTSAADLASEINRILDERERGKSSRLRAALYDRE